MSIFFWLDEMYNLVKCNASVASLNRSIKKYNKVMEKYGTPSPINNSSVAEETDEFIDVEYKEVDSTSETSSEEEKSSEEDKEEEKIKTFPQKEKAI